MALKPEHILSLTLLFVWFLTKAFFLYISKVKFFDMRIIKLKRPELALPEWTKTPTS